MPRRGGSRCRSTPSGAVSVATDGDALDQVVAIALGAMLDGSWGRLKACRNCRWTFYDQLAEPLGRRGARCSSAATARRRARTGGGKTPHGSLSRCVSTALSSPASRSRSRRGSTRERRRGRRHRVEAVRRRARCHRALHDGALPVACGDAGADGTPVRPARLAGRRRVGARGRRRCVGGGALVARGVVRDRDAARRRVRNGGVVRRRQRLHARDERLARRAGVFGAVSMAGGGLAVGLLPLWASWRTPFVAAAVVAAIGAVVVLFAPRETRPATRAAAGDGARPPPACRSARGTPRRSGCRSCSATGR